MSDHEILLQARERLAEKFSADYTKRAILAGEWDRGMLVAQEIEIGILRAREEPPLDG